MWGWPAAQSLLLLLPKVAACGRSCTPFSLPAASPIGTDHQRHHIICRPPGHVGPVCCRLRAAGGKSLETVEALSNDKATMESQLAMQVGGSGGRCGCGPMRARASGRLCTP